MPKKEREQGVWKTALWCALCALGIYLVLQGVGALLVAREVVGEEQAAWLVQASAGIAALSGVLVMGRGCRSGRLLLGAGSAAGLVVVVLLCTLAAGKTAAGAPLAALSAAAAAGGLLGALVPAGGGKRRGGRHREGKGR